MARPRSRTLRDHGHGRGRLAGGPDLRGAAQPVAPFAGTLIAYAITVVASYATQQAWTFRGRHGHGRAFPRYCAAQVLCAAVTAGLAQGLVHAGVAPALTAGTTTVLGSAASYLLSRFWVFPAGRP